MKINIANVRSIQKANIDASKIAFIKGPNAAGKTSIITAIAATAVGDLRPYGVTKNDASAIVADGEEIAFVAIDGGDWSIQAQWPQAERTIVGTPPHFDNFTTGRIDPVADLPAKDWAAFIAAISGADTTIKPADFRRQIANNDQELVNQAMKYVNQDIDAVHKLAAEKKLESRRAWERATGERFGEAKAEAATGRAEANRIQFGSAEKIRKKIQKLESEKPRFEPEKSIADMNREKKNALAEGQAASESLAIVNERIKDLEKKSTAFKPIHLCPNCHASLVIDEHDQIALAPANAKPADCNEAQQIVEELADLATRSAELKREIDSARATIKGIKTIEKSIAESNSDLRTREEINEDIRRQREILDEIEPLEHAETQFHNWRFWSKVEELASPSGMRLDRLKKGIKDTQKKFNEIAQKIFPERSITIDATENGVEVHVGSGPYGQAVYKHDPNSTALAVKIIFQILASLAHDKAPIIIDRFDVLEKKRQSAILAAIAAKGIPAIIAATETECPDVDKLDRASIGTTYWIDAYGVVKPIKEIFK